MGLGGPRVRQHLLEFIGGTTGVYVDGVLDANFFGGGTGGPWSFTFPSDVTLIEVDACGGGGGGGAGASANTSRGGGGGGGAAQYVLALPMAVVPGLTYTVEIGAAGTGGVVGGAAASAGGTTSIRSTSAIPIPYAGGAIGSDRGLYLRGGGAGAVGTGAAASGAGGAGGTAGNGQAGGAAGAAGTLTTTDALQMPFASGGGGGTGGATGTAAGANGGTNGGTSGNLVICFVSGAYDITNSSRGTGSQNGTSFGGGGAGGWSPWGRASVAGNGNAAATAGSGFGGGGSGGGGNGAGAAGQPGYVAITYWSAD